MSAASDILGTAKAGGMTVPAVDIPVIGTERLILRAPRADDLDATAAFMATERARFIGGPVDRATAWRQLCVAAGHWMLRGYGMWTLETRDTGAVAGRVGLIFHDGWPEPELGWQVYDGFEGKGLAEEAARAARDAAPALGLDRPLVSLIAPDNARSIRLAERLGAVLEAEGSLLGHACLIYRHPEVPT